MVRSTLLFMHVFMPFAISTPHTQTTDSETGEEPPTRRRRATRYTHHAVPVKEQDQPTAATDTHTTHTRPPISKPVGGRSRVRVWFSLFSFAILDCWGLRTVLFWFCTLPLGVPSSRQGRPRSHEGAEDELDACGAVASRRADVPEAAPRHRVEGMVRRGGEDEHHGRVRPEAPACSAADGMHCSARLELLGGLRRGSQAERQSSDKGHRPHAAESCFARSECVDVC
jgi:hypothetical protein